MSYISLKCKAAHRKNREILVWKNGPSPARPNIFYSATLTQQWAIAT